jgi:urea carboxylase
VVTEGSRIVEPELPAARYTWGGDEFVMVELDEAMSFHANFKALAITHELRSRAVDGVVEIAPANASYLVRFDPDVLDPRRLMDELREIEAGITDEEATFETRIVDVPALYDDPWTRETLMRFRDRHQNPDGTDLEYVARINNFATTDEFVEAHHGSPFYVSMVGFVPGLPWAFQMVPREKMLQVPKYIRPRTDTPALALSQGGAFAAIYPVRGPGGYQLFGMCAMPIFDLKMELPDFRDNVVFFRHGDILKIRPVDREEYDAIRADVEAKKARYRVKDIVFQPHEFFVNPAAYNAALVEELYSA